jgi:hypothetical protein
MNFVIACQIVYSLIDHVINLITKNKKCVSVTMCTNNPEVILICKAFCESFAVKPRVKSLRSVVIANSRKKVGQAESKKTEISHQS